VGRGKPIGRGSAGTLVLLALAALVFFEAAPSGPEAEPPGPRGPEEMYARVIRVVDGDTIEVSLHGRREDVRYIGVDTPETVKPGTPVQCFGPAAHRLNERLVGGRTVRLVPGAERRDIYGRLLAYVYSGGRFINAVLVRRGYARTLTIAPNDAHAGLFHRLARRAGRAGRGLWGVCPA
jgi:micrococcal nuclease